MNTNDPTSPGTSGKTPGQTILAAVNLSRHYRMGAEDLHVLRNVDLSIKRGQWLCILGASGSGKSTLLHLLGGLDTPDAGRVEYEGRDIFKLSTGKRDRFRNRHIGFVFQFYHLLPELNVLENTILTGMIGTPAIGWGAQRSELKDRATQLLVRLGLGERLKHKPSELSGGERQRVAIARALINGPEVLLADEPTGNLDRNTGDKILDLLAGLHDEGQTIVMVTHDPAISKRANRTLQLDLGQIVS